MISGFAHLLVSQVATRLVTFTLTLLTARLLTVEAYGLASVQFHLINTIILLLSREGFRRGCLRVKEGAGGGLAVQQLLATTALCLPMGFIVTLATCATVPRLSQEPIQAQAVLLQGLAAMVELAAEPLFVLAQTQLRFRLRVAVDASAHVTKAALILALLRFRLASEVTTLCLAQLAFATVTLLGYATGYASEGLAWLASHKKAGLRQQASLGKPQKSLIDWQTLELCKRFTLQACEKLCLAEGSKMVMVVCQSSYNQGVYGLVVNLGSLVVRTLFQPYEEAAFIAFGRQQDEKAEKTQALRQRLRMLQLMVKGACTAGMLAAAFGPGYAYLALRIAYGIQWSETQAPSVLALYSVYIALLAVNGTLEAFQHAVASPSQLTRSNIWLVGFTAAHLALSVGLVGRMGAVGLICADACNMVLRIWYSVRFVEQHFSEAGLSAANWRSLFPSSRALWAYAGWCSASSAANFQMQITFKYQM
ncbi:hypothetical protein WJX73_001189 [Symbiochloris irregularis]|uniref:Protein RFT1 homolog n=1 Tax=Symbiochloris irregularis TaxID=706552 RepID=A0AAW1P0U4_9CHLO